MIFNDDEFIGQYTDFFEARESDKIFQFLGLPPREGTREYVMYERANKPPTPEPEVEPEDEPEAETEAGEEIEGENADNEIDPETEERKVLDEDEKGEGNTDAENVSYPENEMVLF